MDFGTNTIEVRRNEDAWGPYNFDLSNSLPLGDRISSAMATAYVGKLSPKDVKSEFSTLSTLIEEGSLATSNQTVQMKFEYPGDDLKGKKVTIVLTVTLNSGARNSFYFYPVIVR